MTELGLILLLEITKLFQEHSNLEEYPKVCLLIRQVLQIKILNRLVILDHRLKSRHKNTPIVRQIVFINRIEKQQEILDV